MESQNPNEIKLKGGPIFNESQIIMSEQDGIGITKVPCFSESRDDLLSNSD